MNEQLTLILGIGNLLWADEGFGVRCVERLNERYRFPASVRLMDGGTQGLYLVQHVQEARCLIIFDAVDYGLEPGTLKVVRDADVPSYMGARRMSLHQTGFQEVLAIAGLTGQYPQELLLVGVQPEQLEDFGGSLTEVVRQQIDPAIAVVLDFLAARGIVPGASPQSAGPLAPGQLALEDYETGRPAADQAYRHGDVRFIRALQGGD